MSVVDDFEDVTGVWQSVADILDPPDDDWEPLPHQIPPAGKWFAWALMGGRGAGKTATAARYTHELVHGPPMITGVPGGHWISIVGPTLGDAITSCVLGPSGLRKWDPGIKVLQNPGGTIVRWTNGVEAKVFGAQSPEDVERFRAGGNRTFCWCEEMAAWRYLEESWQQIRYGLRSGYWPHALITTTPKNRKVIREIWEKADAAERSGEENPEYVMTHAHTKDNPHLDDRIKKMLYEDYEGTRLGRQELRGELLTDIENALWKSDFIDPYRMSFATAPSSYDRCVVGVDPAASEGGETGIIAGASLRHFMKDQPQRPHGYILGDETISGTPDVWAKAVVQAYYDYEANYVVAEKNNGGDMVKHTIHSVDDRVPVKVVWASRSKATRAEPVALQYERGRVHHVGSFPELEDQMLTFDPLEPPEKSPDRMDAMVWCMSELLVGFTQATATATNDDRLEGRR